MNTQMEMATQKERGRGGGEEGRKGGEGTAYTGRGRRGVLGDGEMITAIKRSGGTDVGT
jgi:hypothetical protein